MNLDFRRAAHSAAASPHSCCEARFLKLQEAQIRELEISSWKKAFPKIGGDSRGKWSLACLQLNPESGHETPCAVRGRAAAKQNSIFESRSGTLREFESVLIRGNYGFHFQSRSALNPVCRKIPAKSSPIFGFSTSVLAKRPAGSFQKPEFPGIECGCRLAGGAFIGAKIQAGAPNPIAVARLRKAPIPEQPNSPFLQSPNSSAPNLPLSSLPPPHFLRNSRFLAKHLQPKAGSEISLRKAGLPKAESGKLRLLQGAANSQKGKFPRRFASFSLPSPSFSSNSRFLQPRQVTDFIVARN